MSDRTLMLGVDTSRDGDLVLAQLSPANELTLLAQQQFSAREQAAELLPRLRDLLAAGKVSLHQLSAIVIVNGPGSFTGLRIGLAAVKGLAHATNVPIIAVSSLAVLASLDRHATVAVLIAGRTEYYVRFMSEKGAVVESLLAEADLHAAIGDKLAVVSDGTIAEKLSRVTLAQPSALDTVRVALPQFHAKEFEDLATLDANYVRRPYTERLPVTTLSSEPAASR